MLNRLQRLTTGGHVQVGSSLLLELASSCLSEPGGPGSMNDDTWSRNLQATSACRINGKFLFVLCTAGLADLTKDMHSARQVANPSWG